MVVPMITTYPRVLSHFQLFIKDNGYAGICSEVVLPELKIKTEKWRAGGMDGNISIDLGMEDMEAEFTLGEYVAEVLQCFGFKQSGNIAVSVRGCMTGAPLTESPTVEIPIVVEMRGKILNIPLGTWKAGEKSELKFKMEVQMIKMSIMGEEIFHIDPANMIRIVQGVDQLAGVKAAIGRT